MLGMVWFQIPISNSGKVNTKNLRKNFEKTNLQRNQVSPVCHPASKKKFGREAKRSIGRILQDGRSKK